MITQLFFLIHSHYDSTDDLQIKLMKISKLNLGKLSYTRSFNQYGSFLTFSIQDFLLLIQSTSEGRMAGLTLEPTSCFQPRTPELGIQHLNHQATACLDLPISFLYMSKHCSISVIYSQNNRSIFCTIHFSFTQLYDMKCHSSFQTIKQNKSQLFSVLDVLFFLLSQKT